MGKEEKEEENVFQAKEITCEKGSSGETLKRRSAWDTENLRQHDANPPS